jgi:hypothetical protein
MSPRVVRCDDADLAMGTHDTDIEPGEHGRVGGERQDAVGRGQHDAAPVRAVVAPRVGDDLVALDAEPARDQCHIVLIQRFAALERRRGESQSLSVAANPNETGAALLDHVVTARFAAGGQPRVAGSERRVAGEGQFTPGTEDANAVVGPRCSSRVGRRQQERSLRQIGPVGEALHLVGGQTLTIVYDGERIPEVRDIGEDVDLFEGACAHVGYLLPGPPAYTRRSAMEADHPREPRCLQSRRN